MKLECELQEKTFKTKEGDDRKYTALVFKLADGSELNVAIKGDKAKLLKLSNNIDKDDLRMPSLNWDK